MKVLLAGGGTAGHINPALAIAGYIKNKRNDAEFLFIGNRGGMEQRLVPQAGFEIKSITISGFKRSFSPKSMLENVKTVSRTFTSSKRGKENNLPSLSLISVSEQADMFLVPLSEQPTKNGYSVHYSRAECISGHYK